MKMPMGLSPAYDVFRAIAKQLQKDEERPRKHGKGVKGPKGSKLPKKPARGATKKGAAAAAAGAAAKPIVVPVDTPGIQREKRALAQEKSRQQRDTRFQKRIAKLGDDNLTHHRHNQRTIEKYVGRYEEMRDRLESEYDQKLAELEERYQGRLEKLAGQHRKRIERMIDHASAGKKIRMQDGAAKRSKQTGRGRGRGKGRSR